MFNVWETVCIDSASSGISTWHLYSQTTIVCEVFKETLLPVKAVWWVLLHSRNVLHLLKAMILYSDSQAIH